MAGTNKLTVRRCLETVNPITLFGLFLEIESSSPSSPLAAHQTASQCDSIPPQPLRIIQDSTIVDLLKFNQNLKQEELALVSFVFRHAMVFLIEKFFEPKFESEHQFRRSPFLILEHFFNHPDALLYKSWKCKIENLQEEMSHRFNEPMSLSTQFSAAGFSWNWSPIEKLIDQDSNQKRVAGHKKQARAGASGNPSTKTGLFSSKAGVIHFYSQFENIHNLGKVNSASECEEFLELLLSDHGYQSLHHHLSARLLGYEELEDVSGHGLDELKYRYRCLVKQTHPDVGGNLVNFQKISTSYEKLKSYLSVEA